MKVVTTNLTRKFLLYVLAIIIAIPFIYAPNTVYGATFKDIRGHWAESYINKAVSIGFAKGYPDRTFRPEKAVTRAEFTSMVNKALGNKGTTNVTFSDVPYNEWYYKEVAKGISAAFVGGYDNNTFKPNSPVTREEAAVMISRFVPTYGYNKNISSFKDRYSISTWATDSVCKIYGKGYMGTYENDGKFHPKDPLTRAQTAKIICSILDKENIISSSTTVKKRGTTLSNRIYSNNVTMHSDLGSGDADLSNCIVLGTLYVYGGGEDTITVSNSRVANAYVEKNSSSVRVLAKGQTTINKTTTGKDAILETSSLSGGIYGIGFNEVDIKSSADTTLRGKFIKVNITGSSADVNADSASINTFNVNSSGRNSSIDLDSHSNIGTANVNCRADFSGSGSINTMNVNSSNVTYEKKPRYVKVKSGISSPNYDSSNYDLDIEVEPKHKDTDTDIDTKITLTFDTAVTKHNGSRIYNSDIDDKIYIRRGSSSGTKISFSGSISSNKRVITLTPDRDLDEDTKYYVVIPRNEFYDTKNRGNDSQTTYFTTDDDDYDDDFDIRVRPKHKDNDIDVDTKITLTFDTAVTKHNGSRIYNSDIDDMVYLRRKSSSGTKISFSGSISSNKRVITLTPDRDLDEDTKYYVVIPRNEFYDTRNRGNDSQTTYFTTGDDDGRSLRFYPKSGNTGISQSVDPTISFSKAIETYSGHRITSSYLEDVIIFREGGSGGRRVSFDASINSSKKTITIDPDHSLKEGQKYYLAIPSRKFRTQSNEERISSESVTWTVRSGSSPTVTFTPANNATNIAANSNITLRFSSSIYNTSGSVPTTSYITSNIYIRNATNNSHVGYTVKSFYNNSSGAVMELNPNSDFIPGHRYTVSISSSRFRNSSGTYTGSHSTTFTAAGSIDTRSIDTALTSAAAAKDGIKISNDGKDIFENLKWVTSAEMSALDSAISTANTAKVTVISKEQADTAASTLNTAITTFNNKIKLGSKIRVNISALENAIKDAKDVKDGIHISSDGFDIDPANKWVTQADLDTLNNAIATAEAAKDVIDTFEKVLANTETLNSAVDTFEARISNGKKADKSNLTKAIDAANSKINNVRIQDSADEVPVGSTWVTSDEYKAFSSAITSATNMMQKRDALQDEVNQMISTLEAATAAFNPKAGTKGVTTDTE